MSPQVTRVVAFVNHQYWLGWKYTNATPTWEAAAMIDPFREVGVQSTTKTQNLECQSPQMSSWGSAAKTDLRCKMHITK